jgi:hypothetical protein
MSQYGAHHGPINSGAINHLSFPATETGLSVIQLLGTVEISGTIGGSLYILRTASAATNAVASTPNIVAKARMQLGATTACSAVTQATALSKIRVTAVPQEVLAWPEVSVGLRYRFSAQQQASAVVSAVAFAKTFKTAVTSGAAVPFVSADTRLRRSASVVCSATTSAFAGRKPQRSASTVAQVVSQASVASRISPHAETVATAVSSVSTRVNLRRSALTTAAAVTSTPTLVRLRLAYPNPEVATAFCSEIALRRRMPLVAFGLAFAENAASAASKFRMSATTVAEAVAFSAAADYAVAAPAPVERLMIVPASDRRMEVTL